jgi:hypothetical protein
MKFAHHFASAFCLFLCLSLCQTSFARSGKDECSPKVLEAIARSEKLEALEPKSEGGILVSSSCKLWSSAPKAPQVLLAALALETKEEEIKKVLIAVIERKSLRILSKHESMEEEDATVRFSGSSLQLDTARYQLSEGQRAFGVVFESSSIVPGGAQAWSSHELTLYLPEGNTLRAVRVAPLGRTRWISGCPSCFQNTHSESASIQVSMAKTKTKGLFDLWLTAKIDSYLTDKEGEEPKVQPKDRIEKHRLRFDGKRYSGGADAPWWLGWW